MSSSSSSLSNAGGGGEPYSFKAPDGGWGWVNPDYCEKLTLLVFLETNFCIFTFFLGHCHCLFYD